MLPTLTTEQELTLLRWRPIDEPITISDLNQYDDIEFSDGKEIWEGNFCSPEARANATHWRPITLPGSYNPTCPP